MTRNLALAYLFFCFVFAFFLVPQKAYGQINQCNILNFNDNVFSRPYECEACNTTDKMSQSCATTATIKQEVSFERKDGSSDGEHCLMRTWGGTFNLDLSNVTIPFVGKNHVNDQIRENEDKYLADYIEGTQEYYNHYSIYWKEGVDHAGVLRKLTPMTYQDNLKKMMALRAQSNYANLQTGNQLLEGKIHDYRIRYHGRLCWDFPAGFNILTALIRKFTPNISILGISTAPLLDVEKNLNYCLYESRSFWEDRQIDLYLRAFDAFNALSPFDISYRRTNSVGLDFLPPPLGKNYRIAELAEHLPPTNISSPNYINDYNAWDKSEWGRLWDATPMLTREDTPGTISPYLGYRPLDNPKQIPQQVESVPHVARLYEGVKIVSQILFPYGGVRGTPPQRPKIIDTNSTPGGCGYDNPLPVEACSAQTITGNDPADKLCCGQVSVNIQAVDWFSNPNYLACGQELYDCQYVCVTLPGEEPVPPDQAPSCWSCKDHCNDEVKTTLERKIGIGLSHPYLDQIWELSSAAESAGLFNNFRPYSIPKFADVAATVPLNYAFSSAGSSITPTTGQFLFDHLGGIQIAKDWVVRTLIPKYPKK